MLYEGKGVCILGTVKSAILGTTDKRDETSDFTLPAVN